MSTPAEEELFNWLERDFHRIAEQEVRNEEADRYARQNSSTPLVPGFMGGLWRRWPI